MATSPDYEATPSLSSNESQPSSPSDTTHLMSHKELQRNSSAGQEAGGFGSPKLKISSLMGIRRFPSPRSFPRSPGQLSPRASGLVRSVSEDHVINSHWETGNLRQSSVSQTATSMIVSHSTSAGMHVEQGTIGSELHQNSHPGSHARSSSMSDVKPPAPHRTPSILSDVRVGGLLSRSSTRRSFGREWTRSHWEKVRDLEQESERARRCSKLSSGFAPLMVFGGLVFICIGVSATTNTGKDKERLQKLSAAPMAMGVFMLALGIFLIASWFGCRGRAKDLEQQLLHGSRRGSVENNVVQGLISKLYATTGINRHVTSSPTLPGVTLDGVDVLKPQPDNEVRRQHSPPTANSPVCCRQCGAANSTAHAVLETSI